MRPVCFPAVHRCGLLLHTEWAKKVLRVVTSSVDQFKEIPLLQRLLNFRKILVNC